MMRVEQKRIVSQRLSRLTISTPCSLLSLFSTFLHLVGHKFNCFVRFFLYRLVSINHTVFMLLHSKNLQGGIGKSLKTTPRNTGCPFQVWHFLIDIHARLALE